MSVPFILLPFFVEVALIFALLIGAAVLRNRATARGGADLDEKSQATTGKPLIIRSYENQFELPILFLLLAPLAILTRKADYLFVALAWIFVALRIAHALVHVTNNYAPTRFGLFVLGALVLMAMWILYAAHILLGF